MTTIKCENTSCKSNNNGICSKEIIELATIL